MKDYIKIGIDKKLIDIIDDGKKILYTHQNKKYNYKDPEEQVRASYYIELVERYEYPPQRINFEIPIPRRIQGDYADIVVFNDDEQKEPYIVVECKKDAISDAEFLQAIEQAFGNANNLNAHFISVVSGITIKSFNLKDFKPLERVLNIISDIPKKYGKVSKAKYLKNVENCEIEKVDKRILITALEKCNNTLWDGGKMDAIDAFDELCKIIFVKIRDEKLPRKSGEPYDFQIKTHETPLEVHTRILSLYNEAKKKDPEVFTETIKSSEEKIATVVSHLQGISLSGTDLDTKGVAFERFMEDFFKGKQGQYFTPREVVEFMTNLCEFNHESRVLDTSCGSGGFLLHALDKIRKEADEFYPNQIGNPDKGIEEGSKHFSHWHDFASNKLFGIEVSERIARVSKMNMIIHDDGHTNVICSDALVNIDKMNEINKGFNKENFDLILTNPPFGATIKKVEKAYIQNYILGKNNQKKVRSSQKTEILFIERCYQFLDDNGVLAIILPDGILTNKTLQYVRDYITSHFIIEAIISLPQVTFAHYGAGLKSSILILKKNKLQKKSNYNIFLAIAENVGYDATGRRSSNDLLNILVEFKKYKLGSHIYEDNIYVKNIDVLNNNRLDPYYYSPMFEKILKNIEKSNHTLVPLSDICLDIFNGTTPAKDDYSDNISDKKIVKVASLKRGKVDIDLVENVKEVAESNKTILNGDILILSSAHQATYLGKNPCIVDIDKNLEKEGVNFVGELINIRPDQNIVNPYYLLQLFNTNNYYLLINREKRGQTSHLYPSDMKKILIPIPNNKELQDNNAKCYMENYTKYIKLIKQAEDILDKNIRDFEKVIFESL